MAAYATLSDFYRCGIRAAAIVPQARTVVSVSGSTLAQPMHGLATQDPLRVAVNTGGALPAPLVAGVVYYAIADDGDTLRVATTPSNALAGTAIALTTTGSGVIGLIASVEPLINAQLERDARKIDGALKAYLGPLPAPYPLEVVETNCHLSALYVAATLGMVNPAQPTTDIAFIKTRYEEALKTLERWRAGDLLPIGTVDATPGVLENGTVSEVSPPFDCAVLT
jgi:hypothetical protein